MDVDDAAAVALDDFRWHEPEIARERDQVDALPRQQRERVARHVGFVAADHRHHFGVDAGCARADERAGIHAVAHDQRHPRAAAFQAVQSIDERLQVRPRPRCEDGDAHHQARPPPNCGTRKGLVARSWATVVAGPWPGCSVVSSGSVNTCSRMPRMSWTKLPPGKSVRPIEPANTTSPTNALAASSTYRITCPGECPGT